MKVQIRFADGEVLEGDSEAATATRMGFPVMPEGGNNQIAWISMASIKYVLFKGGHFDVGVEEDPRGNQGLIKVVLRFADGETLRTYKDDTFAQEGEGFYLRIWDQETRSLVRVLVSLHSLKAIFFVNEWDSRSDQERAAYEALGAEDKPAKTTRAEAPPKRSMRDDALKTLEG
jgi:hypothetical protein